MPVAEDGFQALDDMNDAIPSAGAVLHTRADAGPRSTRTEALRRGPVRVQQRGTPLRGTDLQLCSARGEVRDGVGAARNLLDAILAEFETSAYCQPGC